MVNDPIRIGLEHDAVTSIRLQCLCYKSVLCRYNILSCYKLCAIRRAAGILSNRRKSIKRGFTTKNPFTVRPQLVLRRTFFGVIKDLDVMRIPLGDRKFFYIQLTRHTQNVLTDSDLLIGPFTLSVNNTVRIAYSRNVAEIKCNCTSGIDRNVDNITYGGIGDNAIIIQYDLSDMFMCTNN